jgi:aminopeptidase-like protein
MLFSICSSLSGTGIHNHINSIPKHLKAETHKQIKTNVYGLYTMEGIMGIYKIYTKNERQTYLEISH